MRLSTKLAASLALTASLAASVAVAEDIDLFIGVPGGEIQTPNVLLVLDNGANFSASAPASECQGTAGWPSALNNTVGGIEQCALYKVVESLEPGRVKLGVMMFNSSGMFASCPGDDGGCLLRNITLMDAAEKTSLLAWIKTWKTSGSTNASSINIKSNNNKNAAVMQEAWALFAGRTGLSGRSYENLKPAVGCGNNYVIFVGNSYNNSGQPGDGGNASPKAALLGSLSSGSKMNAFPAASPEQLNLITGPVSVQCETPGSFTFPSNNHENNGFYADEWARYMRSQKIKTFTIGVLSSACKKNYEALLRSMGSESVGGGKYFPTNNFQQLKEALETILSEIQSVNSVFASVSLPVSVNTQGTYLNQVFIGMFRPDAELGPRWYGNLKQFKLGYPNNSSTLRLLDADSQSAISSGESGFISECARSYWTPLKSAAGSNLYWETLDTANCSNYSPKSDTPDGNMVEKGAQSFQLRSLAPASRKVLTCGATCTSTLANFNTDNKSITEGSLGLAGVDAGQRDSLINWARGQNVDGDAITGKTTAEASLRMRPSVHGDVVHSRPVAINYAAAENDPAKVVVFYGGNDGMLRAINGNREGGLTFPEVGGVAPGHEFWSFVAPESYGIFKRLRADAPVIRYAGSNVGEPKPYGFDGPMSAYKTASQAWLFATMRRGGRMLYAFDVTNPAFPSLKWRAGCPSQSSDTGCTAPVSGDDFSGIGQTWSTPTIVQAAGYVEDSVAKPMLIMGGGYDLCEDADPASPPCKAGGKGRFIYLLDANTGKLIRSFPTNGRVVADITVVKDKAGMVKYAYAADLNGNLYRISGGAGAPIGTAAPADWTLTRIAALGGTGTDARKFMFAPDIVIDGDGYAILVGSGDREKPVMDYPAAAAVQNYFFKVTDRPLEPDWLTSESDTCGAALICPESLYELESVTFSSVGIDPETGDEQMKQELEEMASMKGWRLPLRGSEKVVTSALTIFGITYFSTHEPSIFSAESCTNNLGTARSYALDYTTAFGENAEIVGGGLPPSPVAGLVTLDNKKTVPFCIGCSPTSSLEGGEPPSPPTATQPKARVFWNIQ